MKWVRNCVCSVAAVQPKMSTRLCVKSLPKHCDERRLRQHFESHGYDVTDVKLVKTKTGKSRQFGFIGLKTEAAAEVSHVKEKNADFG